MASEEKILQVGEAQETPQAITITIVDPSALGSTSLDPSLVAQGGADQGSIVMVSGAEDSKAILQTVTETHMGTEELPIISNISNPEEEEMIVHETKLSESFDGGGEEGELGDSYEDVEEPSGPHCLVCNIDLTTNDSDEQVPVFKTQTSTTQRKVAVFLSSLIGQKVTSRKAHSDILCRRCFSLLDRVDSLEVEIRETKEEIINKYQETVSVYGGRARRIKPATAKKPDYVFPKVEPEDEADQLLDMELDGNFEPQVEDLMDEDPSLQDDDWEPKFKRPRIKKESTSIGVCESSDPPKRKRGRPRKDLTKAKAEAVSPREGGGADDASPASDRPACPVCTATFSFNSQMRRHVRYEHPEFDTSELDLAARASVTQRRLEEIHMEVEEDVNPEDDMAQTMDLRCPWCDLDFEDKELYDEHLEEHGAQAFQQYLTSLYQADASRDGGHDGKEASLATTGKGEAQSTKCRLCEYACSGELKMEQHVDKCHDGLPRVCGLCGEHCSDKASLHAHLVHHFSGVIECPICPIRFSNKNNLLAHLQYYHASGYVIVCGSCNTEFTNYEKFEAHQAHEHGLGAKRTCEMCEKELFAVDFEEHLAEHEAQVEWKESRSHACNLCQASFMFISHLYHHKYQDHASAFTFKCNECERRFRTGRMLSSHKWGHRYGTHQCPVCRLKYRQVDQLKRHLLTVHPEIEGYSCKFCSTMLKNYSTYVAHLKFKHPKEAGYDKRPVRCRLCGESFAHKVQWQYHMRNHTRSLQTCGICGISIKNLEIHMNLHTREKKYECRECGAVYHNKASFHFHVKRVHMGEEVRKHMCDTCEKGFLTPADLRIHMSRVHLGERNYWCAICKKGYKSKVSLTYHQRLHTGERPHLCTLCGRSFRVPSYLKRHVEHDHRAQYTGIYYKQGRPKSQEDRSRPRRHYQQQSVAQQQDKEVAIAAVGEMSAAIPEVVQITVPMEMGGEVISAVSTVQDMGMGAVEVEQDGVVYVVYEN
ncbi:zinc finger protein 184-like isoform X2 [Portunus trituberculatus]|uniref:zinc finger protein 184-like isoform X2 n=1 Tax=Portunus trituberculatus TaxID=210409 RepID=UPI001E1D0526|nr:zinc finger protein 184-like isoform X2 [Portunus trituberculatus]